MLPQIMVQQKDHVNCVQGVCLLYPSYIVLKKYGANLIKLATDKEIKTNQRKKYFTQHWYKLK